MNETGTIRRQEDNGLSDLVRSSGTARWRLGGQLLEALPHCVSAFRARRPRAHRIDADTAPAIFGRPRFGQQVDGGLARSIEAHASQPVIGDHRRYIDDCPLASLRHQRSKFRDEEVRHLDVERIHAIKHQIGNVDIRARGGLCLCLIMVKVGGKLTVLTLGREEPHKPVTGQAK